ncbi:protein SMG9 [Trifolium repens]|nr:protein SMG9 [Trifolium repens]
MAGLDPSSPSSPKILLSKEDSTMQHRHRLSSVASLNLNLLSDSWNFQSDHFLPFLSENTNFTVIGVIGRSGVGKSTIMNELYRFDPSSHGMLPPFAIQSQETRAMAKDCSIGIEPRISSERFILLDTQPVFSDSALVEMMMKLDGSSTIPVMTEESLPAELTQELMDIQLAVFLASICHILLVVTEGVHDDSLWHLMSTVDLLKHDISDPSLLASPVSESSSSGLEKDNEVPEHEYMATPVFIHTKLQDQELSPKTILQLRKGLLHYFKTSSFVTENTGNNPNEHVSSAMVLNSDMDSNTLNLFVIPFKKKEENPRTQHESYISAVRKLQDQILSMKLPSFKRPVSELEWLKSSAKIWEQVRNSSTISEYCKALQDSSMYA